MIGSITLRNYAGYLGSHLNKRGVLMKKLIFTLVVTLLICGTTAAEEFALSEQESACLAAINKVREKSGLPPFELSAELSVECRKWSAHLQTKRQLYHGASSEICCRQTESGERAFQIWSGSPPHRAMFFSRATKVGIGESGGYWTLRSEERREFKAEIRKEIKADPPVSVVPKKPKSFAQRVRAFVRGR